MSPIRNASLKWMLSAILFAVASISFAWMYYQNDTSTSVNTSPKDVNISYVDEKADKLLREMSNTLKNLKEFSLKSEGYFEIIDSTGKRIKMNNSGEAFIKRPNKIKVARTGEKSDVEFYCDGKLVTLYGKKLNYYASSVAAPNLNETFDRIGENLGIQLPGTDLLYTDVYEGLMQDVTSGRYVGKSQIGNVKCDQLSFIGKEVDWKIWIEESGMKLPRKYVIVSKLESGSPEASIEIKEWKTDIKFDDKMFSFVPPKGSQKIDFLFPKPDTQTKSKNE